MGQQQTARIIGIHQVAGPLMNLGRDFDLSPDVIHGNGVAGFGTPGSGKTGILARLLEQASQFSIPIAAFDKEGDLLSAVECFPRGILGTFTNCPTGRDIISQGLQVVYDLKSWPDSDMAGQAVASIVNQLLTVVSGLPYHERVPALVALDEAAYWLPQRRGEYLSGTTFSLLHDAFHELATTGRKRGLTPLLFTQKISELEKAVLAPGLFIFGRQTVDTDLKRYMEYLRPPGDLTEKQFKNRISTLPAGKAIVKLPDGSQRVIVFHERESFHASHTPVTQAAINRYGNMPAPRTSFGAYLPDSEMVTRPEEKAAATSAKKSKRHVAKKRGTTTDKRKATSVKSAAVRPLPGVSVVEPRVRAALAENASITDYQLARLARCSVRDAQRWRARIQGE